MEKIFLFILSACVVTGFCFSELGNTFRKMRKIEHQYYATTINVMTTSTGDSSYTYEKGITKGRAISLGAGVVGLISLFIGWRAKVHSWQKGAKVAVILGLFAVFSAIVHLSIVAGAVFGSGSGKAGSLVALLLAEVGITLGGLVLRSRNTS